MRTTAKPKLRLLAAILLLAGHAACAQDAGSAATERAVGDASAAPGARRLKGGGGYNSGYGYGGHGYRPPVVDPVIAGKACV